MKKFRLAALSVHGNFVFQPLTVAPCDALTVPTGLRSKGRPLKKRVKTSKLLKSRNKNQLMKR